MIFYARLTVTDKIFSQSARSYRSESLAEFFTFPAEVNAAETCFITSVQSRGSCVYTTDILFKVGFAIKTVTIFVMHSFKAAQEFVKFNRRTLPASSIDACACIVHAVVPFLVDVWGV